MIARTSRTPLPQGGLAIVLVLMAGNLMFVPIALLFGGAFWALSPLGFRARFDRAAGTFAAVHVQRTASPHQTGRLDDEAIAEFIAAQVVVVTAASDAFLSAGQDGRPDSSNADFEPILAVVGHEALARYFKVPEDAIAASLRRAPRRYASPSEVEAAWVKFREGLSPEDRARYVAIPKNAKGASDDDLGWAARTYWQRLSRMNHAKAAIIVRNANQ